MNVNVPEKTLDCQIKYQLLFYKYIKLGKMDFGDYLFFKKEEHGYFLKIINNISEININQYPMLENIYFLFFEKVSKKIYVFENGLLKKENKIKYDRNVLIVQHVGVEMPLELSEIDQESIIDRLELWYMFREYKPLQVKIMLINNEMKILYFEDKVPNKDGNYSVDKNLVRLPFELYHFTVKDKRQYDREMFVRNCISENKIIRKNNMYYINNKYYIPIKKN